MKDFKGKVAVVTGAASGIGRALAERFSVEGMKVVLADIEAEPLQKAFAEMKAAGAEVIAVRTDVSRAADVEALARATLAAFGGVHIVCNNAGVSGPAGPVWTRTTSDWEWVLGVNLWGVIHGIRSFVPLMLEQGTEAHVVNTASIAGLISLPNTSVYCASKHAVVTISEALHHELAMIGSKVKVSVVCPGFVRTRIIESARNRPAAPDEPPGPPSAAEEAWSEGFRGAVEAGIPPEIAVHKILDAIAEEKLYVLTHAELKGAVKRRLTDVLEDRTPAFQAFF